MMEADIVLPKGGNDKDKIDPYRDQLFWQTTAAKLLGQLKDAAAVEPLMKVMLDPAKADIQMTALAGAGEDWQAGSSRNHQVVEG
jgi:hypothetical protein